MTLTIEEMTGTWPKDDPRRIFVLGAKWWECRKTGFTMWQSDIELAEAEAEKRFPGGAASKMEEARRCNMLPPTDEFLADTNL